MSSRFARALGKLHVARRRARAENAEKDDDAVGKVLNDGSGAGYRSRARRRISFRKAGLKGMTGMIPELSRKVSSSIAHISSDSDDTVGVFQQTMRFSDIEKLVSYDSIAYRIWRMRSEDPFNKWNHIRSDDALFVEFLAAKLEQLSWKRTLATAWSWAVLYRYALILKLYDDETFASDLTKAVTEDAQITRTIPVSPTLISKVEFETDTGSQNYLMPKSAMIRLGEDKSAVVHASRFFILRNPSPDGHPLGMSIFKPVWDDFTIKKNQDVAFAETAIANARKLPVFWFEDIDDDEMDNIQEELEDLRAITTALTLRGAGENSKIQEILGAGSLNPTPYAEYNLQNISAGTGVPMHVLLDTPAGALVASNENVKNYLSKVSNDQTEQIEPVHVALIKELISRGQVPSANFDIVWNPLEEITFSDKTQAVMRAGLGFLNYSKGLIEHTKEDGTGIMFDPTEWEILPTEWGGFEIHRKPELEPDKFYGNMSRSAHITASADDDIVREELPAEEYHDMMTSNEHLMTLYNADADFVGKHYDEVVRRITWFLHQRGLYGDEVLVKPHEMRSFENALQRTEPRYMKYRMTLDALHDGGVSTVRIDGRCRHCRALKNVYGIYRTDSADIPLLPLHEEGCEFSVRPY